MTFFLITAVVLVVAVLLVALARLVSSGGGSTPAPHVHDWTSPDQAPERPYRDLRRVA